MKYAIRVLLLLLATVATAVQADDRAVDRGTPGTGKSQTPQPEPSGGKRPAPKPARSFTPSEQVGADSAVSFPVDI